MNAIDQLKAVLCDPEGKCCVAGSDEDRTIVGRALEALAQPEQNLACAATQARLATAWGYVKAQPDNTAKLYEELRSIIDGGSESFTHNDAVQYLKDNLAPLKWSPEDTAYRPGGLAQPDTDMSYTIALQRAIEWHCDGKAVPISVAESCPYHAEKLNQALAQPEQVPEDTILNRRIIREDPGATISIMQGMQRTIDSLKARSAHDVDYWIKQHTEARQAELELRRELESLKTEQEPVALETVYETIIQWDEGGGKRSRRELARRIVDLYTSPPQRQPLTIVQIKTAVRSAGLMYTKPDEDVARAIEAAHGIGNKT